MTKDLDPRRQAMLFYWQGFRITRIAEMLGEKAATVHSWKRRDKWESVSPLDQIQITTAMRYNQIIMKSPKDGGDFKELDLLGRQMERHARIGRFGDTGRESDLNPNIERRTEERRKPLKNHFDDEQKAALEDAFIRSLRAYQKKWLGAAKHAVRNILKTRQCGATWYFSHEALYDALRTGKNKIFLSASRSQALVFRRYIVKFARQFGVELKGNPIVLSNGAELHFLGTNSSTAQSYNGDLYIDEYFWINGFAELERNASGMATLDDMHITLFSTPSTYSHEAYPFWSGAAYNRERPKNERVNVPVTYDRLKDGLLCADGQWRHMLTIEDAIADGMKATLENLQRRRSPQDFANLYMCQFMDDLDSLFPLKSMRRCMVESLDCWPDFKPWAIRPLSDTPVWIGYDPSSTGDSAGCAVVAPPRGPKESFRVLERFQFRGLDFEAQAEKIQELCERYNVSHIGIDETGLGRSVVQLVRKFFPAVEAIRYTVAMKTDLVHKAKSVIDGGRLTFDAGCSDIIQAFMAIRKVVTPSGKFASYETSRAEDISHGDVAWAIMHALIHEPMTGFTEQHDSTVEIY